MRPHISWKMDILDGVFLYDVETAERKLLENNVKITSIDWKGRSFLHRFVLSCQYKLLDHYLDILDPNAKDNEGYTPFMTCILFNSTRFCDIFLRHKNIDYHAVDNRGNNWLHCIAYSGNLYYLQYLYEKLKPFELVNSRNKYNETPLLIAIKAGNLDMIDFFYRHDAEFLIPDVQGINAYDILTNEEFIRKHKLNDIVHDFNIPYIVGKVSKELSQISFLLKQNDNSNIWDILC